MPIEATRQRTGDTLVDLIDRILDKGLVINADIQVSVAGVELLGIKIRAALSSFETAVRYGLEFPSGTHLKALSPGGLSPASEAAPLRGADNGRFPPVRLDEGLGGQDRDVGPPGTSSNSSKTGD